MTSCRAHHRRGVKPFAQRRSVVKVGDKTVLEFIAMRTQARTSNHALLRTSFQSESHPVPRGASDPAGSIIKRQTGDIIINNREQTDNTAALRQRPKR